MSTDKSLYIIPATLLILFLHGCSTNNAAPTPLKRNFSFSAEQAEANRLNTARIDRIDEERSYRKRIKDADVEIHRTEADVRRIKALEGLEKAKPDTVIIDRSHSTHIH